MTPHPPLRTSLRPLALAAALCCALPTLAQTLPEVTVKADATQETATGPVKGYAARRGTAGTKTDTPLNETPQSVSVITRDELDARNVQNIGEALRYTAGATPEVYGSDPRYDWLFVRGFSATTLSNYLDGLLQLTPACCFSVYRVSPFALERVEVLRGPSSVLYGQNAPGGIVNRLSKRPTADVVREIQVDVGSFQRKQLNFDLGGASADGEVLWRVIGGARKSQTQYLDTRDDRAYLSPSITWKPDGRNTLTVLANILDDRNGAGFTYTAPAITNAAGIITTPPKGSRVTVGDPSYSGFDHHQRSLGYEYEHRARDSLVLRHKLRASDIAMEYRTLGNLGLQAGSTRIINRRANKINESAQQVVTDNQLEARFDTGGARHTALFGLDYLKVRLDNHTRRDNGPVLDLLAPVYNQVVASPTTLSASSYMTQTQLGLYAQDQIKFGEQWVATLGARYDKTNSYILNRLGGAVVDQNDNALTGRAGLTYLLPNGWAPYVSYSESFLPAIGTDYFNNTFKPTTGKQFELGAKYQPAGGQGAFTASLYDLRQQNVLTTDTDPTHIGKSIQVGAVKSRGLELEGKYSLRNGLDLTAAYAYTDVRNVRINPARQEGKALILVPKHAASLWANYRIRSGALQGFGLGGGVRYVGATPGDADNVFENPAVTLLDAVLSYSMTNWRFALNVNNLANKKYQTCYGTATCTWAAERSVLASARYTF